MINAKTLDDLEEAGNEIAVARQKLPTPKRVSTHLSALRRIGPERPTTTRYLLISEYGLTGIEQGRWVSSKESLVLLQWVADSCADLVTLPAPWFITLSRRGNIGLAIGARGKSRPAAHLEGYRRGINLTKLCGAIGLIPWEHEMEGNPNVDNCRHSRRKILQLVDDHQGALQARFAAGASADPHRDQLHSASATHGKSQPQGCSAPRRVQQQCPPSFGRPPLCKRPAKCFLRGALS